MAKKFLYFTTGDGANATGEAACYEVSAFRGFDPIDATSLGMYFTMAANSNTDDDDDHDLVDLTIKSNTHKAVMKDLANKMANHRGAFIVVCDADNSEFTHSNITDCAITVAS